MKLMKKKDKLFYKVASKYSDCEFDTHFMRGHKKAITCFDWMPDGKGLISGSKDCELLWWDIETQKKERLGVGKKFDKSTKGHFDEICCMAIS